MNNTLSLLTLLTILPLMLMAQVDNDKDWAPRKGNIKEVVVYGRRPMKEICLQQTRFDSLALK